MAPLAATVRVDDAILLAADVQLGLAAVPEEKRVLKRIRLKFAAPLLQELQQQAQQKKPPKKKKGKASAAPGALPKVAAAIDELKRVCTPKGLVLEAEPAAREQ